MKRTRFSCILIVLCTILSACAYNRTPASQAAETNPTAAVEPTQTFKPTDTPSPELAPASPAVIAIIPPQETPSSNTSSGMVSAKSDPSGAEPDPAAVTSNDQPLYAPNQVGGSSGMARLQFQPGATSAVVTGDLGANETRGYLVYAQQGQIIIAGTPLQNWEDGVRVKITTAENAILPDLLPNLTTAAALPATQDYIVWVTGGSYATSYHLAVTIPVRIRFDSGATSASLDGSIDTGETIWYVLRASAGQTLTAGLDGFEVDMIISGLENPQVLVTSAVSWTGTLPDTQDYLIQVTPKEYPTAFTLNVNIQ